MDDIFKDEEEVEEDAAIDEFKDDENQDPGEADINDAFKDEEDEKEGDVGTNIDDAF